MKILLSLFIALVILTMNVGSVFAATDPKISLKLDCNTLEKLVTVGFQSNPESPASGAEIIAAKFVHVLTPSASGTFDDVKNGNIQLNPTFSNVILPENTNTPVGQTLEIKTTLGFTGGSGLKEAKDLLLVKGIIQKAYTIHLKSAELYPKDSTQNIYKGAVETLNVDPSTCAPAQTVSQQTPSPTTPTPTTTNASSRPTSITISSDKKNGNAGEMITITALIKNRGSQGLDWSQTAGASIQPDIKNTEEADGVTRSVLTFSMPENSQDIALALKVGTETQQITIDGPAPAAVPELPQGDASAQAEQQEKESLAERLRKRREQQNLQQGDASIEANLAQPENVHGAADGLTESGPGEIALISLLGISGIATFLLRRKKV